MLDFTLWGHLTQSSHMTTHLRVIVILWLVECFMTHDCDVIWCNDFRTWLTFGVMGCTHVTRWAHDLGCEFWLVNGMLCDDSYESSMDFTLWLTTSHTGLCSARWWVTRDRVVRRYLYKALGFDQGIGHEPSLLHLRRLKSQHHGKSSSLSPTHLSSPIMATA